MSDIKVCLVAAEFLPNWGGVGTYCVELAKALSDDVEFHVVTLEREKRGRPVYSKKDMLDFFDDKIDVHILGKCPAEDTFLFNAKMQMAVHRKLPRILKEYGIDLVHSNFPQMPDILLKLTKRTNIPYITTVHTTIEGQKEGIKASHQSFFQMDLSEKCTLLMYPMLRFAENIYLRKSKNLIAVSNWMRTKIKKSYSFISDLYVVHNGVDVKQFSPRNPSYFSLWKDVPDPIVLFSSRLTTAKGVHYLIQAIPKILERNREVHFVFAGAGPKKIWLNLLKKLEIDEKFYTFLGYVDYKQLPMLYAKSDIFVAPSLYENLPIRILEAMACECTVVASNICAIPEAVKDGENGILISPNDVDGLSKALLMLLEDEDYRRRLAKNARRTVAENFSLRSLAKKVVAIYEELCA